LDNIVALRDRMELGLRSEDFSRPFRCGSPHPSRSRAPNI
jgi:hypothetical protein